MVNGVEWDGFEIEWELNKWMKKVENKMDQKLDDPLLTKSEYILVVTHQHYSMLYQLFKVGHV